MAITTKSRALGAIWGTCVADALGGPVQFKEPSTFPRITDLAYIANRKKPAGYVDHLFSSRPSLIVDTVLSLMMGL